MVTLTNNVNLIGNLGKDVQITTLSTGTKKASFSLATQEKFKNNKGEWVSNTTWHNITAWGKNAELMSKSLAKGNKVAISGTITNRSYEDKLGQKRNITEILVVDFMKVNTDLNPTIGKEPKPF
jgi:single-strand DNA-binding protein